MKQSTPTPAAPVYAADGTVQFGDEHISLRGVPIGALIAALEAAYGAHAALKQAAAYAPDRLNGRGIGRRLTALAEEIRGLELAVAAVKGKLQ